MTRELTTFEKLNEKFAWLLLYGKISLEKRWFLFPSERTASVLAVSRRAAPVHALFHCQKLFPLEIYRSGENRGVISGPNETKKASDPTRAKDNWRAILSCPFSLSLADLSRHPTHHPCRFLSGTAIRLRKLTIVKCTYGSADLFPRGLSKQRNLDIYRSFPALR